MHLNFFFKTKEKDHQGLEEHDVEILVSVKVGGVQLLFSCSEDLSNDNVGQRLRPGRMRRRQSGELAYPPITRLWVGEYCRISPHDPSHLCTFPGSGHTVLSHLVPAVL